MQEYVGAAVIGACIAGGISYLFSLLRKRHDKVDKIEERVQALEKAHTEVVYLKAKQEEMARDLREALSILTEMRIQMNMATTKRRAIITEKEA